MEETLRTWSPGFVRVLENLESPGILFWYFPGLESPGKRPLVLESSGNLLTQLKIWSVWEAVRKINIEILGLSGLKWILEPSKNQFESWKSPGNLFLKKGTNPGSQQWFFLLCGLLHVCEGARWPKSCNVIGYPSGQVGNILPSRDYPLYPTRKISMKAI